MAGSSDWPIEPVPLTRLRLDPANVRIRGSVTDENSILEHLYADEDVMDLVRKIARNSYFDNEQPIVYLSDGNYTVLEGNRRVSALKGLADPDRVPAFQKRIEAEAERALDADFPTTIRVMIAPTREAALPVVARLHTRDSKKSWVLEQQAAFYYDRFRDGSTIAQLRAAYPDEAAKIPRFITMGQMISRAREAAASDPVAADFIDSRAFKMTTFEYLYNSPVFRGAIHMSVSVDGIVTIDADDEFLRRLFVQIVLDMKDKRINTRKIRVASPEHAHYVGTLTAIARGERISHDEDDALDEDDEDPVADSGGAGDGQTANEDEEPFDDEPANDDGPRDDSGDADGPPEPKPDQGGGGQDGEHDDDAAPSGDADVGEQERPRGKLRSDQHLDFAGMPLRLDGPGMRVRYDELQTINVRRLPNATFDFLRSFIECAIKEYFVAADDPVTHPAPQGGPVQLKHCLAHLESRLREEPIVKAGLVQLRSKQHFGDDYFTTAAALNDSNHEPNATVRSEQVNLMWAQVKPLVKLLLAGPPKPDDVPQGV